MGKFEEAIEATLKHEGVLSNNPQDPGRITKYGVSLRWLRSLGLLGDIDRDGDVDEDDIRSLTRTHAIELYRVHFWRPQYDAMPAQIAAKVFDTAVNMGNTAAHRILQKAIREMGSYIVVDGHLGPATLRAVLSADPQDLLQEFRAAQSYRYAWLVIENPKLETFLRGWLRRAAA